MNTRDALIHRDPAGSYPVITRGEGISLIDEAGNRYIDGVSGAGNVTLGHGQKQIAAVMAEQAETMAYCFSAFFTNRLTPGVDRTRFAEPRLHCLRRVRRQRDRLQDCPTVSPSAGQRT